MIWVECAGENKLSLYCTVIGMFTGAFNQIKYDGEKTGGAGNQDWIKLLVKHTGEEPSDLCCTVLLTRVSSNLAVMVELPKLTSLKD